MKEPLGVFCGLLFIVVLLLIDLFINIIVDSIQHVSYNRLFYHFLNLHYLVFNEIGSLCVCDTRKSFLFLQNGTIKMCVISVNDYLISLLIRDGLIGL